MIHKKVLLHFYLLILCISLTIGCNSSTPVRLKVWKPSYIDIPSEVRKIFIDPKLFHSEYDALNIKARVLASLRKHIQDEGRFQAILGKPRGYDPNREVVAVIQGDIISSGELDVGQISEKITCSAFTGAEGDDVSMNYRGLPCKPTGFASAVEEGAFTLIEAIVGQQPALDDGIRVCGYKNAAYFAQLNLSFTTLGKDRETLAIRSDSSLYGRRVKDKNCKHVNEATGAMDSNGYPKIDRIHSLVRDSQPDFQVRWYRNQIPGKALLPYRKHQKVIQRLVEKSVKRFLRTISPYRVEIQTAIAEGGNANVTKLIQQGEYSRARKTLQNLLNKEPADLYNIGLTYEAAAKIVEDYEDAYRFYSEALEADPEVSLYAQGVGRMEFRIGEFKRLESQKVPTEK